MLSQSEAQIKQRAQAWQAQLPNSQIIPGESTIGGGSLPGETLPTWLLQFKPKSANKLLNALRAGKPPIIARIQEQSVVLDPRTVQAEEELIIIQRLKEFLE